MPQRVVFFLLLLGLALACQPLSSAPPDGATPPPPSRAQEAPPPAPPASPLAVPPLKESTPPPPATPAVVPKFPPGGPPMPEPPTPVRYVRNRTFSLHYEIDNVGPSGVRRVEVWATRDTSQYQRVASDASPSGPFSVTVREPGRYGYRVVPVSGVGLSPRGPAPGDQPQTWVEVDETPPAVAIQRIEVLTDAKQLTLFYTATDPHLKTLPITLMHGPTKDGPWTMLKAGVANSGRLTLPCQGLPFQFYLRVEAADQAGNVGTAITHEPVKVDLKVPQVRRLAVRADSPAARAPEVEAKGRPLNVRPAPPPTRPTREPPPAPAPPPPDREPPPAPGPD